MKLSFLQPRNFTKCTSNSTDFINESVYSDQVVRANCLFSYLQWSSVTSQTLVASTVNFHFQNKLILCIVLTET